MSERRRTKIIDNTSNYATKGVAGTGLGLGIAGTALALLNNNGLGGLGGLLGNNGTAAVLAENAQLKAERHSDNKDADTYRQTLSDNRNLREELYSFIKPIAEESAANRERVAVLESKLQCEAEKVILREEILKQKIDLEAVERKCCCDKNAAAIAAVASIVAQITKVGVPNKALCPGVPPVTVQHTTTTTTPAA